MACLHDHSCEDHDCSSNWSLYKHIDLPKVHFLLLLLVLLLLRLEINGRKYTWREGKKTLFLFIAGMFGLTYVHHN